MTVTPVWRDPIVAELHTIREQLAERFHNDLAAYSRAAEAHCRELGFQIAQSPAYEESRTLDLYQASLPGICDPRQVDLTER
ncbi:hypothetical protein [Candidatus Thiodictyon syntrophicum]|jgi:hypothetical protein|uniref:hypothetical protein n=1 Tax=Candidatus Thiodictyon syntrophicum TaxID=1166950 RepID=UPI0012FE5C22|nr:hypothetical protein [Candidatus Thiodictyon syntrophicum]